MALFESVSAHHLPLLLRLGFAARLRAETSDTYVSQYSDRIIRTNDRATASIFFFQSGAIATSSATPPTYPVAVLSRLPDAETPTFVSLNPNPIPTTTPTLLKFTLATSHPPRLLISLSSISNHLHLSLRAVPPAAPASLATTRSKWELFHLEIELTSIGNGFLSGSFLNPYIQLSQALTHALLSTSVRFRLRSPHTRLLRRQSHTVIQGPPSDVPATHETDLLLTAFRVANDNPPSYALQDLSTTHYLAIFRDTPVARLEKTSQHPLRLRAVSTSWGAVCLAAPAHDSDKKHSDSWLMTGPRGRLEVRSHSRAWETLQVEVVRQSYDAVLSELPVHGVFRVAEQTLRNAVCEKVEKEITAKDVRSKVKHGGFNHSAALAGMSDAPKVVGSKASAKMRKKQPTSVKNAPVGTASKAPVAAAVAASSLPRNKASKKAAKRNKKKKRKGKMTTDSGAQGHYVANVPARESSVGLEQESSAVAEDNESKLAKDALLTSEKQKGGTANQKSVTGSGPPCSACGRQVSGTYTTAMGRYFHPQCFCCGICRRPMGVGAGQFRERDGIPYCQGCFATQLASRCARCSKPILETVITAMEKTWHKDCLTCTICRLPLTQTFWLYADKPNEPRCSRCVTGEEYVTSRQGSSKMVNLPMFGRKNTTSGFPAMGQGNAAGGGIGGTGQSGRVQLISPVLPSTSRQ